MLISSRRCAPIEENALWSGRFLVHVWSAATIIIFTLNRTSDFHAAPQRHTRRGSTMQENMKKALRETQTLRAKNFRPAADPLLGGAGRTAKILSAGDGHYLHLQTEFGEDRCTQFRVIVVTDTARPPQTHTQTGPVTIHCAAMLSAQCKKLKREKARRVTHHIMRSMRCSHLALTMTLP